MRMRGPYSHSRFGRKWRGAWLAAVIAGVAAIGLLVMLLWNWIVPAAFAGAGPIGYWQALGLLLLTRILFGGRGPWRGHPPPWNMSPEERDELKARFRERFGERSDHDAARRPTTDSPDLPDSTESAGSSDNARDPRSGGPDGR